ncbi:MAG: hypothetical protein GXC73_15865 [Chitinophagaceae bacterium]|nr:hypothetical protein [Chitinophagaceae bacterium]
MNKLLSLILVSAMSFLLMGCPYETEVPIDQPSVKFPSNLLGKWEPKSSSDELLTISKKTEYVVTISKSKKKPEANDKAELYEAYLSEIDGVKFLNITEKNEYSSGSKFYLYKLEVSASASRLTLSPVTENIDEKFSTSAELKAFIQKNMQHSFFYEKDDEVYLRLD